MLSKKLFSEAKNIFPGGVNSPVRAFKSVELDPIFIKSSNGAYLHDVDGNSYIDYINSWGALALGHNDPDVTEAIKQQLEIGVSFGACHELEIKLAKLIQEFFPLEMMRFCNSGTEAGMAVIRLARAFTKKNKIIKFAGNYHGHTDSLLVSAGSGLATQGIPDSAGILDLLANQTLVAEYNDLNSVEELYRKFDDIAAIIVEPVCGNAGFIEPEAGFLQGLREISHKYNSILIFDEVMTGFRVHLKGAQGLYNIKPDLTMLGKIIGAGLPVGAFGGSKDIMSLLAPQGNVYQAGTLSGNPLAMIAGYTAIKKWSSNNHFAKTEELTKKLINGIQTSANNNNIPLEARSLGAMFGFFFTKEPVKNYTDAKKSDLKLFKGFYKKALENGVYFAPSQFEAGFVSNAHSSKEIDLTIQICDQIFKSLL